MDSFQQIIWVLQWFVIPAIIGFFVYHSLNIRDKAPMWPYIISVVVVAAIPVAVNIYSRGELLFEGVRVLALFSGIIVAGFAGVIIIPLSNFLKNKKK